MESTKVIKVKHGETLRRFSCRILNGELDLDFNGLREKIIGLFKFTPDAELTLTYVDEDGDIVTLGDNEDLRDVVRQSLNPLRVTVKLSTESSGMSSARTSGSSTPLRSPQMPQLLQNLSSNSLLKSVPVSIRQIIVKICDDLASTGTPSAQTLTDLVRTFSEMGLPYLNQLSDLQAAANVSKQDGASGCTTNVPASSQEAHVSAAFGPENPSARNKEVYPSIESKGPANGKENAINGSGGVKALARELPGLEVLKAALESANHKPPHATEIDAGKEEVDRQSDEQPLFGKFVPFSSTSVPPTSNTVTGDNKEASGDPNELMAMKPLGALAFPSYPPNAVWSNLSSHLRDTIGGAKNVLQTGFGSSLGSNAIPVNECPFSGVPLGNSPVLPPQPPPCVVQPRRNHGLSDDSGIAFHRGVQCDGCGVHPITGPRFKSKVKDDYDLCSICFAQMGNESDYIRMDRPISYRHHHPHSFRGFYDLNNRVHAPLQPPAFRCGGKASRHKLDSRFIQDVNILDGTIMAPSTSFTKIWKMRNNGSVVWPQGTQLVWIGGDKLSDIFSVDTEIASAGLPVEQELDIAVDFVAPDRPGRYISYWRMASPSGQKFGQRVWVLIHVNASSKELQQEGFRGFNLNLPPINSGISGPEIINVNPEPLVVDSLPQVNNSSGGMHLVEPVVDASPEKEQEVNFPINDSLLVGGAALTPVSAVPASLGSYPIIDLSEVAPPELTPLPAIIGETSAQDVKENAAKAEESLIKYVKRSDVEEALLKELEDMGFKQVDLNKEILRLNGYNLEKSVDDLCGVSGWDPILEELRDMGFCDKATNHKLLKKNNGSIKRVVMDLIAGEK
ncbi:protein JOKA2-like isoform X1 [Coffea arabica]|uniref:Protein JOKA2-like isoform X1 n=1 Tax=Coffea arabica TaxID=13443 RepID=A0ABM4U4A3_COFAR|nr:protein NBR1 homolog isoform X1 [Coffea arabica]